MKQLEIFKENSKPKFPSQNQLYKAAKSVQNFSPGHNMIEHSLREALKKCFFRSISIYQNYHHHSDHKNLIILTCIHHAKPPPSPNLGQLIHLCTWEFCFAKIERVHDCQNGHNLIEIRVELMHRLMIIMIAFKGPTLGPAM